MPEKKNSLPCHFTLSSIKRQLAFALLFLIVMPLDLPLQLCIRDTDDEGNSRREARDFLDLGMLLLLFNAWKPALQLRKVLCIQTQDTGLLERSQGVSASGHRRCGCLPKDGYPYPARKQRCLHLLREWDRELLPAALLPKCPQQRWIRPKPGAWNKS